jgi:WD40 repeat protein
MPRALLYHLLQTWATDPRYHPRPLARARKKGTPAMSYRFAGGHGVRLWDLATGRPIGDLPAGHPNWVGSVAFSPDGKTLAGGGGYDGLRSRVWLWDLATGRVIGHRLTRPDGGIGSVAFSPDGTTLATASGDGTVRLWDLATGRQIGKALTGHTGPVTSAAFSPDGKTLASASVDGTVRLWDVATHR